MAEGPTATREAEVRDAGREGRGGPRLRLGAVPYLNVEPMLRGLAPDAGLSLEREVPSRLAERLRAGELDLAVVPAIALADAPYAIVPGIAIASRGAVASVLLFHARPLAEVRRVATDASSRTSVALARILLRERLGRDPEYVSCPPSLPQMLAQADAALLIGDPALDAESPLPRLDLGAAWTDATGLPFVYAVWAGPKGAVQPADVARLERALDAGRAAIPEIARERGAGDAARAARYEAYLRERVVYALGAEELRGLREFLRRAHALGLIAAVPELVFHADR